jgi:membrane protein YdbS with pleckstrin-like domain
METPPSDRPARRSPASWAIVVVLVLVVVLLNIWYDYHHPLGIMFDVALALVVLVRYVSKSE